MGRPKLSIRILFDLAQDRDYWRALLYVTLDLWLPWAMEVVMFLLCPRCSLRHDNKFSF